MSDFKNWNSTVDFFSESKVKIVLVLARKKPDTKLSL